MADAVGGGLLCGISPHRFGFGFTPSPHRLAFPSRSQALKGGVNFFSPRLAKYAESRKYDFFNSPLSGGLFCFYPPDKGVGGVGFQGEEDERGPRPHFPAFGVTGLAPARGRIGRANGRSSDGPGKSGKSEANGPGGPGSAGGGPGVFRAMGITEQFDKYR